jgi:LacI family transcriptional regulator
MRSQAIRIGLVLSYSMEYCRGVLRGIKHYAEAKQHWIFTPIDPGLPELAPTLRAVQPAGVTALVVSDALAEALTQLRRPLVNVSAYPPRGPIPRVGVDNVLVGRLAAAYLLDQGFRQFGFVGHPNHTFSLQRQTGFCQVIEPTGHPLALYYEHDSLPFDPLGRLWALDKDLRRWLQALPKPAGVFACNDIWGLQLSEACRQAGVQVPEDVAMLGVDNDDLLCELARPSLSSVAIPSEQVGYEAAALLDRLLARARAPTQPLLFPPVGVVTRRSSDVLAIGDPDVAAAVRFIREHAHLPLRVEDVVRAVPVSRRSLERRFRAVLHRGLWQEIRRVHLERAKDLLAASALPIHAVAERAGFSDAKQLSVVFRQETGLTPTAYRRQFRAREGANLPSSRSGALRP